MSFFILKLNLMSKTIFKFDEIYEQHNDIGWFNAPRALAQDERLSIVARAIILNLLSHHRNFVVTREKLHKTFFKGIGKDKFGKAWKELQERGFLEKKMIKSENGKYNGVLYIIHPFPKWLKEKGHQRWEDTLPDDDDLMAL